MYCAYVYGKVIMQKIKKIMAAGLWSKRSDLRPWAVEHPVKSVVLAIGFNTGMYVLSSKLADIVMQAIEDNTEKLPVVDIQTRDFTTHCFCGAPVTRDYYCDEHQDLVF